MKKTADKVPRPRSPLSVSSGTKREWDLFWTESERRQLVSQFAYEFAYDLGPVIGASLDVSASVTEGAGLSLGDSSESRSV